MRQSDLFTKTSKQTPKDEVSKNAQILIRAGFVFKEMAGVYTYLPLGLRVLNNVQRLIREEMTALGASEMFLTTLQDAEIWKTTNRWDDELIDNWFKTKLKNETELGLAFTHEDPLTRIMSHFVNSYKDLPVYTFQIQNKFRNETRAKSGIMRCREFLMKDMYSFSKNKEEHDEFYEKSKDAYMNVYKRCGLGDMTYLTYASGGSFSKYSHEFQTLTDAGEDLVYLCDKCNVAINKEVLEDLKNSCPECGSNALTEHKAIEVGNIFPLSTRFSEPLDLSYTDEKGEKHFVYMGSYGIGPGRLMGTVVEALAKENSMVWPKELSPYQVHLISLAKTDEEHAVAEKMYTDLQKAGYTVLIDNRDARAGQKFADSDLIGIPNRLVLSSKTLEAGEVEFKDRVGDTEERVSVEGVAEFLKNYV